MPWHTDHDALLLDEHGQVAEDRLASILLVAWNSTVQYSTVQDSTVQYSTPLYRREWHTDHDALLLDQHGQVAEDLVGLNPTGSMEQYSTVQYSTVQYSTVQYRTVQYSTVQYTTVP